jgi:hypothetical protein
VIKVTHSRSKSSVSQEGSLRKLVSPDGLKWATSKNMKRSLGDKRFDVVEVWTLKQRIDGKVVAIEVNVSADRAMCHVS